MKANIITKKITLTEDVNARIIKKLPKLDKFFPSDTVANIKLFSERGKDRIEITIYRNGTIFRAEESDRDIFVAIDRAIDVIERQIRKNRTRLEKKLYVSKEQPVFDAPINPEDSDDEIIISKRKRFEIMPMTIEEAIMQMNLLSHEFFLFENADTGEINLVYKRLNDDYGVIEAAK